jgi:hypothetical protein
MIEDNTVEADDEVVPADNPLAVAEEDAGTVIDTY